MAHHTELIRKLTILNEITETLNQADDITGALGDALQRLVSLMGLETGWIFLVDPAAKNRWFGRGYTLAAHYNLPPAMGLDKPRAWKGDCACQGLCNKNQLNRAYNEVRCTRLSRAGGDRYGLMVHASTPLRSGNRTLGILNVAAADWDDFSPEALAVLTNAGSQMGIALERARLVDMLQEQRVHEQAVLLELSNQMLARPDMADLSQYLVEEVRMLLNADACAMLVPCDDPRHLDFCAASGWRDDPVRAGRQVPANERSGAGWAMHNQQPLIQRDHASAGAAPWSPDWVRAEGFKGHAVMPLIAGGHAVGALVIDMREPRMLDEDETRFLRLLANQAAIVVENARLYNKTLRQQHLERELALGQEIQLSMLPQVAPDIEGWEFAVTYEAARVVAGDFYDFFVLPREEGRVGLVVADVADKGVPAALFMALSRTVIRTMALSGRSPASALMRANSVILNDVQSDLFLSAFYAKVDTRAGRMAYANAGHNPPLWFSAAGGSTERLDADGIVLGVLDDIELEEERIDVAPGDVLVFYTDGVTEAMNAADEEFGMGRFQAAVEAVAADPGAGANDIVEAVRHAVNTFIGSRPQTDDFTLFVVKRLNREETI